MKVIELKSRRKSDGYIVRILIAYKRLVSFSRVVREIHPSLKDKFEPMSDIMTSHTVGSKVLNVTVFVEEDETLFLDAYYTFNIDLIRRSLDKVNDLLFSLGSRKLKEYGLSTIDVAKLEYTNRYNIRVVDFREIKALD